MPPFVETVNIADFILVLNRSLENNKSQLIYAGQWRNSTCQIFNQWVKHVVCLRKPITKWEKLLTIILCSFKKVINFVVFSSFLPANLTFLSLIVIVRNKLWPVFYVSFLSCSDRFHVILSSIRGQTHKKLVSIC